MALERKYKPKNTQHIDADGQKCSKTRVLTDSLVCPVDNQGFEVRFTYRDMLAAFGAGRKNMEEVGWNLEGWGFDDWLEEHWRVNGKK